MTNKWFAKIHSHTHTHIEFDVVGVCVCVSGVHGALITQNWVPIARIRDYDRFYVAGEVFIMADRE